MSPAERIARLRAAAGESAVTVRDAAPGERPDERIDGGVAHVLADAVIAESAAVVLFGGDDRLRPAMSCAALVAHARPGAVVDDFGAALERFDGRGRMISICGPSRTADIEKKLVIGVHGPREVTIVLLGEG